MNIIEIMNELYSNYIESDDICKDMICEECPFFNFERCPNMGVDEVIDR